MAKFVQRGSTNLNLEQIQKVEEHDCPDRVVMHLFFAGQEKISLIAMKEEEGHDGPLIQLIRDFIYENPACSPC